MAGVKSLRREERLRGKERLADTGVWRIAGVARRQEGREE